MAREDWLYRLQPMIGAAMDLPALDLKAATRFADIALGHLTREYPHKVDHVMDSEADVYTPRSLHPIFFGSFDWHSCVHGHWLLVRLLRLYPDLPQAVTLTELLRSQFQAAKVQAEQNYLARTSSLNFEQPYGWAWFLMLVAEISRMGTSEAGDWLQVLAPLRLALVERLTSYLRRLTYPIRSGTHTNTAFAIVLAAEYAKTFADIDLQQLLEDRTASWYGADANAQAWEPGGDDFFSPTLLEAEAMRRLAPPQLFLPWFQVFLPEIALYRPDTLFTPAFVSDREDGKIGHLDGLNLSRAWCFRLLAGSMPADSRVQTVLLEAAYAHYEAARTQLTANYMAEHWLASFALLALSPS